MLEIKTTDSKEVAQITETTKTTGVTKTTSSLDLLADVVSSVFLGENNVGICLENRRDIKKILVIDTINNCASYRKEFTDNEIHKTCTCSCRRYGVNLNIGIEKDARYSKFTLSSIIAFVNDTVERNGVYRESYATLEGAHKDGSGSSSFGLVQNNRIDNVELADANSNRLQYLAWIKLWKQGYWFSLSAIDNFNFNKYIISKEAKLDIEYLRKYFGVKGKIVNNTIMYYI